MNIIKSNINFKINLYQNEGVRDFNNTIFPPHFLIPICGIFFLLIFKKGKPGSGKTTLLKFLLKSDKFFYKKFDYIYILSPSFIEYNSLFLPEENFTSALNWEWIKSKVNLCSKCKEYVNVLFVFDDVIGDLYNSRYSKEIMSFIFNRRHLLTNGMISIIITSQKYTRIPTEIRSNSNMIIFFKLNNICIKKLFDDLIFEDKEYFDLVVENVFAEEQNFIIYRLDNNKFYKNFDSIIINK